MNAVAAAAHGDAPMLLALTVAAAFAAAVAVLPGQTRMRFLPALSLIAAFAWT